MIVEQGPDDRFRRKVSFTGQNGLRVTLEAPQAAAAAIERYEALLGNQTAIAQRCTQLYQKYGYLQVCYGDEGAREHLITEDPDCAEAAMVWLMCEVVSPHERQAYSERDTNSCWSLASGALTLAQFRAASTSQSSPAVTTGALAAYLTLKLLTLQAPDATVHSLSAPTSLRSAITSLLLQARILGEQLDDSEARVLDELQAHLLRAARENSGLGPAVSALLRTADEILAASSDAPPIAAVLPSVPAEVSSADPWLDSVSEFHESVARAIEPAEGDPNFDVWMRPLETCLDAIRKMPQAEVVIDESHLGCFDLWHSDMRFDISPVFDFEMRLLTAITRQSGHGWFVAGTYSRYSPFVFKGSPSFTQDSNTSGSPRSLVEVHDRLIRYLSSDYPLGANRLREILGDDGRSEPNDEFQRAIQWWTELDAARRACGAVLRLDSPIFEADLTTTIGGDSKDFVRIERLVPYNLEQRCAIGLLPAGRHCALGGTLSDIVGFAAFSVGQRIGWGAHEVSALRYRDHQPFVDLNSEMAARECRERWAKLDAALGGSLGERRPTPLFCSPHHPHIGPEVIVFVKVPSPEDDSNGSRSVRPAPGAVLKV